MWRRVDSNYRHTGYEPGALPLSYTATASDSKQRANLVEKVLRACRADSAMKRGGTVLVAVSGGPDSTALLHSLARGSRALGIKLHVGHVDHSTMPSGHNLEAVRA